MKILYTAHATATAGREGRAETDDKQISVSLSKPGSGKPGTNPEQLFACGYGACFGSAVEAVAKKEQLAIGEVAVQVDVSLNQDDEGYFISAALDVSIAGVSQEQAEALVQKAHGVCPYSKATRGNVDIMLKANGQSLAKAA